MQMRGNDGALVFRPLRIGRRLQLDLALQCQGDLDGVMDVRSRRSAATPDPQAPAEPYMHLACYCAGIRHLSYPE